MDRIHEVHVNEKSPKGYRWSRERFTKIQATTRLDFLWPEIRIGMSKAATKKQKQEWTTNQSLITLERKMEAAMPCKMDTRKRARKPQETAASECTDSHKKTMYACIVEAHESTRKRLESTLPRYHEDHIAEKGSIQ